MAEITLARPVVPVGWRFWLWWTLSCAAGWGVGGPIGVELGSTAHTTVAGYFGIALGGVMTGTLQWVALRRSIRAGWWVAANVVCAMVMAVLALTVNVIVSLAEGADTSTDLGWVVVTIAFGAALGIAQWLALRRQLPRTGWWVLISAIGWVTAGLLAGAVSPPEGWAVVGAVYGAITGYVLVRLLQQPALLAQSED